MPKVKKTVEQKPVVQKPLSKVTYTAAVGRRKEAVARVRLSTGGEGTITVNSKPIEQYFSGELNKSFYTEPFRITNTLGKFTVTIKVVGGGSAGQRGAVIHGISRALEKVDKEKFRPILKKQGLLTRDPRAKERRKAGFAQKARAKKQSPKR